MADLAPHGTNTQTILEERQTGLAGGRNQLLYSQAPQLRLLLLNLVMAPTDTQCMSLT